MLAAEQNAIEDLWESGRSQTRMPRTATTANLRRRRAKLRDRHGSQASHVRTATKQPEKAAPEASLLLDASGPSIVAGLEGHDLNGLRRQWRAHLGGEPPVHLPRWLLMRVLAYRLHADAFGGLDKSIQRTLRSDKDRGAVMPLRPARASDSRRRRPEGRRAAGARMEWQARAGMILDEGFAWNGQTFGSLSQIAKAMTGTNGTVRLNSILPVCARGHGGAPLFLLMNCHRARQVLRPKMAYTYLP
jgi:DUF2924 family protein